MPSIKSYESIHKTVKRDPALDKYDPAFNVRQRLRNEASHHPVHYRKSASNSLMMPASFIRHYSRELLGVENEDLDINQV